jgi:hypothetical protein
VQAQSSIAMSFTGTQDKCKTCDKTVHFIDLLTADGVSYHKTCFKCSHCKGTLSVRMHMALWPDQLIMRIRLLVMCGNALLISVQRNEALLY